MARRRVTQCGPTEAAREQGLGFARGMANYVIALSPEDGIERPHWEEMEPDDLLVVADDFPDHPLTPSLREGVEVALGQRDEVRDFWERQNPSSDSQPAERG